MSRRDSRVHIAVRQNDALLEFENFKKKFLLANKHITKLNSTLSVRIEELNMQISTLYAENLRLRASEIALSAQLKREREKSRKIMSDAETATMNLMKHLGVLRHSLGVPDGLPTPSPPSKRQQPGQGQQQPRVRAVPMPADPSISPVVTRLSRVPNIPGIFEEDEEAEIEDSPSASRRTSSDSKSKAAKPRASTSRLPLPVPGSAPHIDLLEMQGNAANVAKRKAPTRRQSGLLTSARSSANASSSVPANLGLGIPRTPSPAFGSPIRLEAALLAAENDEMDVVEQIQQDHVKGEVDIVKDTDEEAEAEAEARRERREKKKRAKEKEAERERERELGLGGERESDRERKRVKEDEDLEDGNGNSNAKRLRDVTNSPRRLSPLDTDREAQMQTPPSTTSASASMSPTSSILTPISSSTPPTTPTQPIPLASASTIPYTASQSLSAPQSQPSQADIESATTGRERRTRKSVNYAEPKLNTKMRKPDPVDAIDQQRRSHSPNPDSTSTGLPTEHNALSPPPPRRPSSETSTTVKRKKPPSSSSTSSSAVGRLHLMMEGEDGDESEGAQADSEFGGPRSTSGWVNVEGRRRSVQSGSGTGRDREREREKERGDGEDVGRRHSIAV